ncbi:MAG: DNA methyltransferase [Patescibacteria group bacterium]|nr:DNA methyltransferase [Patescibacteria group bacterium]
MAQSNLADAKNAKNDEFYTQYHDIEKEINSYIEYDPDVFKDKVILLPCDDPEWSNFTKYFAQNFDRFGLKKLISTSYAAKSKKYDSGYQPTLFETDDPRFDKSKTAKNGKIFTLTRDKTGDGKVDVEDLEWSYLKGDGDFRSEEVEKLRDEADIVVTNPPFSLFREFLSWVLEADKKFIIIGNLNTVANREVFPLVKKNLIWLGATCFNSGAAYFIAPKELYDSQKMSSEKNAYLKDGKFYWRVNGIRWYTNIEHGVRHHPLKLMSEKDNLRFNTTLVRKLKEKYEVDRYPKYSNYDAIDVPLVSAIPDDYKGEMGVPVSFMDKYCPEQFEIIGIGIGSLGKELGISPIPKEIDDSLPGHSSVWRFYIMAGKTAVVPYSRIIIKHKDI